MKIIRSLKTLTNNINLKSSNQIGTECCNNIGEGLNSLANLTSLILNLSFNSIDEKGCKPIMSALLNSKNLTQLEITFKYLILIYMV